MRLTLQMFGHELDITLGPVEAEAETTNAGDSTSTVIGFSIPAIPWEDAGSSHQFDPEPDGENP